MRVWVGVEVSRIKLLIGMTCNIVDSMSRLLNFWYSIHICETDAAKSSNSVHKYIMRGY